MHNSIDYDHSFRADREASRELEFPDSLYLVLLKYRTPRDDRFHIIYLTRADSNDQADELVRDKFVVETNFSPKFIILTQVIALDDVPYNKVKQLLKLESLNE